ncbi:MAG: hypothetical protein AB7L90_08630 [Hyphomicrobiaceae bacterium]
MLLSIGRAGTDKRARTAAGMRPGALIVSLFVTVGFGGPVLAQSSPSGATVPALKTVDLTPEERAERDARKACKVRICAAFHNHRAETSDVSCNVLKSWRKEQLSKMLEKAKVSWPWGRVKCTAEVRLKGDMLAKALTNDRYEAALDKHKVACEVDREKADPAHINFEFSPKVTFAKGKAVKALLNWGKIEAPTLIKGAMWTATATDNTFNVLQSTLVEDINDFIGPRCDEVKADWVGK